MHQTSKEVAPEENLNDVPALSAGRRDPRTSPEASAMLPQRGKRRGHPSEIQVGEMRPTPEPNRAIPSNSPVTPSTESGTAIDPKALGGRSSLTSLDGVPNASSPETPRRPRPRPARKSQTARESCSLQTPTRQSDRVANPTAIRETQPRK
jgi:hypothetical protein